jgi:transposase
VRSLCIPRLEWPFHAARTAAEMLPVSASRDKPPPITSALAPDLVAVSTFIRDMIAKGAIAELVVAIVALLVRMRDLNTELMGKLASQSRKRPPSEAMRRLQQEQPLLCTAAANDAKPAQSEGRKPKKRGAKVPTPHGRPQLPAHLPRVANVLRVPGAKRICPRCNVEATTLCIKTTAEKLDVRPSVFIVSQTKVETCSCPKCHQYIVTADKGDEVLDRGILGDELLVQAVVDHYQDAVPWERMESNARQQGVPLAANTLASSAGRVVDLFDPIVRHLRDKCLSSRFTALDATRMPVLDPLHPLGIKSGALWLIEGDHRYACFLYAPSGHAAHLKKFFEGRTLGSVMCDGSATNNCVEKDAGGRRGGCNAHGRRGLVEALRRGDARAVEGLEIYAKIFHVDAESKRLGESLEQRSARRLRETAPRVAELRAWVDLRLGDVEPRSVLGKALRYIDRQWSRLTAFLRDPCMELTNNEVESGLRTWVLDRKMWLFVGHEASARRAADALTLITTCKKMGIDPRAYLRDTLAKILAGEKSLVALLPETYCAARVQRAPPVAA